MLNVYECFESFPTNSKVVIYMPMIPEAGHPHSFASLDAGRGFDHAPLVTHWFQHTNRILSYSISDIFRHVLAEQLRERGISLQNYKLIALTATIDANCWKVITGSVCHVGLCTLGSSAFRGLWWLCRAAGLDMATKGFRNDAFSKASASHRGLNWRHASKMLSRRRWFGPLAALNPKASSAVGHKAFVVVECCWMLLVSGPFEDWMILDGSSDMVLVHHACQTLQCTRMAFGR